VRVIQQEQVVVISGETGCGKTTQVMSSLVRLSTSNQHSLLNSHSLFF